MNQLPLQRPDDLLRHWYARIDAGIDARRACVAMVVRVIAGPRVEGFGTGFFYLKDGWPFFVTAMHVVADANESIQRGHGAFLIVRGRKGVIDLSKSEFFCSAEWDAGIAPLWKRPAQSYSHVEFLSSSEVGPPLEATLFAFTGFPASKNKTYTAREVKPVQRIITFSKTEPNPTDQALPFLSLQIESGQLHTSELDRTNLDFPQGLAGMSGGPVLAVSGSIDRPKLTLCGMGIAWRDNNSLKVLHFDLVDVWLTRYFTW